MISCDTKTTGGMTDMFQRFCGDASPLILSTTDTKASLEDVEITMRKGVPWRFLASSASATSQ